MKWRVISPVSNALQRSFSTTIGATGAKVKVLLCVYANSFAKGHLQENSTVQKNAI
jgi:hypothetical protein